MMKKNSIFWGAVLVLMAALVIISEMGLIKGIGFWTVVFTVVFVAALIKGIVKFDIPQILFSIAFLCIIWDDVLGIQNITPWPVLFAALLGSIGFSMIFGGRKKKFYKNKYSNEKVEIDVDCDSGSESHKKHTRSEIEQDDGEEIKCSSNFGSIIKYANSDNLRSIDVSVSFGAASIYLDNAKVPGGEVIVNMNVSFGGVELYVPRDWCITNHMNTSFGGIDVKGNKTGLDVVNVVLVGQLSFSGVDVIYV